MTELVGVLDPRIFLQDSKKYGVFFGALKWENYRLPATGLSDSLITWSNFITLGQKRVYSDTFEIEYTLEITLPANLADFLFLNNDTSGNLDITRETDTTHRPGRRRPVAFMPFPLHSVTDQVRINLNGQICNSRPAVTLYPRMRYMSREALKNAYVSICPVDRPYGGAEPGAGALYLNTNPREPLTSGEREGFNVTALEERNLSLCPKYAGHYSVNSVDSGLKVRYEYIDVEFDKEPYPLSTKNYQFIPSDIRGDDESVTFTVVIRESVLASPFSSRLDKTYGRPIFNVHNLDIQYTLNPLVRMLTIAKMNLISDRTDDSNPVYYWENLINPADITIHITKAELLFQVATLKDDTIVPEIWLSPYPEYVPYITDYPQNPVTCSPSERTSWQNITLTSGVYTLAQIPQSIYIFVGPTYRDLTASMDSSGLSLLDKHPHSGNIKNVTITMGNNTQILSTFKPQDLYRICKQNGLDDPYERGFMEYNRGGSTIWTQPASDYTTYTPYINETQYSGIGCGSVLRLIPGIDILPADMTLVPGATGDNLVFQVSVNVDYPVYNATSENIALWVIFERCGTLSLTKDSGSIDMCPIKDAAAAVAVASQNLVSANADTLAGRSSDLDYYVGSGIWDKIKSFGEKAINFAKDNRLVSRALGALAAAPGIGPIAGTAATTAKNMGFGLDCKKRRFDDISGGAIMGGGDFYD